MTMKPVTTTASASTHAQAPVVLDLDASVGPLQGARVLSLASWQEALRFACTNEELRRFGRTLDRKLPPDHGTVLLGSGDFHHLSLSLIKRLRTPKPFQVVVLDNHPDNMRYPFGVHCGSWVQRVTELPQVEHVHVVGITSADIGLGRAWENRWWPLLRGRLTYWCVDVDVRWTRRLGLAARFRPFDDPESLIAAFAEAQRAAPRPAYLSIDKDVFAPDVVHCNWDQGRLRESHALMLIESLRGGGLVGSDITGEVSQYRYRSRVKCLLSALDAQPAIPDTELARWQTQHHALNLRLLGAIAGLANAGRADRLPVSEQDVS